MRATLMERGRLWAAEVPDPVPARGEVLVKSLACGICGSDLHAARHTEQFVATSREAGGAYKLTTLAPVVLGIGLVLFVRLVSQVPLLVLVAQMRFVVPKLPVLMVEPL